MSIFITEPSAQHNVGISLVSMEEALNQQTQMDNNNCNNCIDCRNCINCSYCNNCQNCIECGKCIHCENCENCSNCQEAEDCTSQPIQILGLRWLITIRANNTMKIGCQDHSLESWENFNDEEIEIMSYSAPIFWKQYKTMVMSLAKTYNLKDSSN